MWQLTYSAISQLETCIFHRIGCYLGAPKKPPFRAPRQDNATRMGMTDDKPWSARLANVCKGGDGIEASIPKMCISCFSSEKHRPQPPHRTAAAPRGSSWCSKPRSRARTGRSPSPWSRLSPVGCFWQRHHRGFSADEAEILVAEAGVIPVGVNDLLCDKVQIKPEKKHKGRVKRSQRCSKSILLHSYSEWIVPSPSTVGVQAVVEGQRYLIQRQRVHLKAVLEILCLSCTEVKANIERKEMDATPSDIYRHPPTFC